MTTLLLALSFFIISFNANAFPEAPFDALKIEPPKTFDQATNYDFEAIVSLSNCSGSLVHFSGQPKTSQAYVLTNGHCINTSFGGGFLQPGEFKYKAPDNRRMDIMNSNLSNTRVNATLLVYATMTGTDSALYRINKTYAELETLGIHSKVMATTRPLAGESIEIISGYWRRGFSCHIDSFIFQLQEGHWTFEDSIRYSDIGCEVYGGTSGSPILSASDHSVIGVNNTGNESGRMCTVNNPCEIDQDGKKSAVKGRGYGQQTYLFYSCLSPDFQIDLATPGCKLLH